MYKNYPSHSKVKCRKPGCNKEIRQDRMADHLKNVHNDTSNRLEGQQVLSNFFVSKIKQADAEEVECDQNDTQHQDKYSTITKQSDNNTNANAPENAMIRFFETEQGTYNEKSRDKNKSVRSLCSELQEGGEAKTLDSQNFKGQEQQEDKYSTNTKQSDNNVDANAPENAMIRFFETRIEKSRDNNQSVKSLGLELQEGAKALDSQDFEEQEQRSILAQLQNIEERVEPTHSIPSLNTLDKPESDPSNISNVRSTFGIPSKKDFEKFFQGHAKNQVSTTKTQQQSSVPLTNVNVVTMSSEMEVDDNYDENIAATCSSSSTLPRKNPSFKRRKLSSPSVNLSVTERIGNVHEDVLVVYDAVKEVSKQISTLSISNQLENDSNEENVRREKDKIEDAKLVLVNSAQSVSDLVKYADHMSVDADNNLICECCFSPGKEDGRFTYNFSFGDDFTNSNMPREFRNLKSHVVRHLKSKGHIEKTKESDLTQKEKQQTSKRQHQVGMVLGRQAYKILKCGDSDLQYETDVVVLNEQGCDVGNLNHSRKFVAEFKHAVRDTLMLKTRKHLNEPLPATGRPTPISIIADKLTPNRKTLQIVGFHGYVSKKVQSLIAGVPALSGCDGKSVTRCLQKGLSNLEIPIDLLPSRIVGGAFDGEYYHLSVDSHLLDSFLVSEEAKAWYTFQWDVAHILELAEKDIFKDQSCQSVKQVFKTISEVSKSFSHGKSFRELVEEASATIDYDSDEKDNHSLVEKVKVRVPGHFSETRFATYSSTVIDKWLNNYPLYYKIMNREQKDNLDRIDNAPFVFSCGALCDVYTVVGNMSNAVQKPNIPCWEIDTIIDTHLNVLQEMADNLDPGKLKVSNISESSVLPTLASMTKEVFERHVYKDCPILTKVHHVHSTRSAMSAETSHCENVEDALRASAKPIRSVIENFIHNFKDRMSDEKKKNEILTDVGILFDVSKIIELDSVEPVKKHLEKYADLAKLTENLSNDVHIDELLIEYDLFSKRVKEIAPHFLHRPKNQGKANTPKVKITYPTRYDQVDLYKKMLETPTLYKDTSNVMHLALTGVCRTHCEAIVEGMGSVLKLHDEKRGRLDPKTIEAETIIRWQGPHPGKGATKLIEESLDRHFDGRDKWHFVSKWDKARHFMGSKVLKRINDTATQHDKISFD